MAIIPESIDAKINFARSHATAWTAAPTTIGLTAADVTALGTAAGTAYTKRQAALTARDAARTATGEQDTAVNEMTDTLSELIKKIKAFAAGQPDPNVIYDLAQLPRPKPSAPLPPPEAPSEFFATLLSTGYIDLRWNGTTYGGTYFTVERRTVSTTGTQGAWSLIGTTDERGFVDQQVPSGVAAVEYRILAYRTGKASEQAASATVPFGTPAMETGGELKIAA